MAECNCTVAANALGPLVQDSLPSSRLLSLCPLPTTCFGSVPTPPATHTAMSDTGEESYWSSYDEYSGDSQDSQGEGEELWEAEGDLWESEEGEGGSDDPEAGPPRVSYEQSPLSDMITAAMHAGDVAAVREALLAGADVHDPCYGDGPPLTLAALKGNVDVVTALIREGRADVNNISLGETALVSVAREGMLEMCRLLLDFSADVDQSSTVGVDTRYHIASFVALI